MIDSSEVTFEVTREDANKTIITGRLGDERSSIMLDDIIISEIRAFGLDPIEECKATIIGHLTGEEYHGHR